MAREFDVEQSEYLEIDQAVVGKPLAIACWFNAEVHDVNMTLVAILDKDVDDQMLHLSMNVTTLKVRVYELGGVSEVVECSATYTPGTWHHACGLFVTSTDRRVLFEGGNKGTGNTDIAPVGLDRTSIGRHGDSTGPNYFNFDGKIAEIGIWDLSVWPGANDGERADNFEKIVPSLAKGYSPLFFPLGLKAYWPLIRDTNDRVGGYNLT